MAAEEIRADYDGLAQVASKLANQSQQIQQMTQNVQRSMENLHSGWEGRGSQAFFNEMQSRVLPSVNRLHQALQQASQATQRISQTIQQAEDEAAAPFKAQ